MIDGEADGERYQRLADLVAGRRRAGNGERAGPAVQHVGEKGLHDPER
jgi:hypothetical protein